MMKAFTKTPISPPGGLKEVLYGGLRPKVPASSPRLFPQKMGKGKSPGEEVAGNKSVFTEHEDILVVFFILV